MPHLSSFAFLKGQLRRAGIDETSNADICFEEFLDIIRILLRAIPVDEAWYLAEYPDVAAAIAAGDIRSAQHHFIASGYFEGRLPSPLDLDEVWYLSTYPDVADGIAPGDFQSAQEHFREHGYDEGRRGVAD
jgi:hypothetical protein